MLTKEEQERYSRQTILPIIGVDGQEKLKMAHVVIVGVGALGTHSAELLARAGVGRLTLIDNDIVEASNLQRQTLFGEQDIGKNKVDMAEKKLRQINSLVSITSIPNFIDEGNADKILNNASLIIDGTDNMETRFLLNDLGKKKNLPWIYAGCVKTSGYVMPIFPEGPCLRCFIKDSHDEQGDSVCSSGILNTLPAAISSIQVSLALKILLRKPLEKKNHQKLYHYDGWNLSLRKITVKKTCASCLCKLDS